MNEFLEACGAAGPLLLGIESPGEASGEVCAFDLPFVVVGRDPRADLRLSHSEVSGRHAYLQLVDGQLLFADLGSRIGTYLAGKCLRLGYVDRGQAVRIGPNRVRLLGGDSGPAAVAGAGLPPLTLELTHRSLRDARCEIPEGLALVGSGSDCQVRLIDPSVAGYHCSLVRTPRGLWVVDLLGAGGVRVNGIEVSYARLYEGDALQVGHSLIRPGAAEPSRTTGGASFRVGQVFSAVPEVAAQGVASKAQNASPAGRSADLIGRVLAPMVERIGRMQQQMADELGTARTLVLETFDAHDGEEASFVDRELEQLDRLTQGLHALRDDLVRQTKLLAEHAPARIGTATAFDPAPVPSLPAPKATRPDAPGPSPEPGRPKVVRGNAPEPGPGGLHEEQIHALLWERISRMNGEPRSRWQKVLSMFPGAFLGRPER